MQKNKQMLNYGKCQNSRRLFQYNLQEFINLKHPIVILANKISWIPLIKSLEKYYSGRGRPSHSIRKMLGLLILQYIYNLSDRKVVMMYEHSPYFQYFCGEAFFQVSPPCNSGDLSYFRKRLTTEGVKEILAISVEMHGKIVSKAKTVLIDTTVQETNITYPTDSKSYKKVIDKCNAIAKKLKIKLRQSYKFVSKKLMYIQRYTGIKKHAKKAIKATKKLKTLAGRQFRNLKRELKAISKENIYMPTLKAMQKILEQTKTTKNKVYSLTAPEVSCIAKGKSHKKYEFGTKISVASLPGSNVILNAMSFKGNPNDGKTLVPTLESIEKLHKKKFERIIVDRGYRGKNKIKNTEVILPGTAKDLPPYKRRKHKLQCRLRSAVEAVISHLKFDHKMGKNYLKGAYGAEINALLAAAGMNFKLLMRV